MRSEVRGKGEEEEGERGYVYGQPTRHITSSEPRRADAGGGKKHAGSAAHAAKKALRSDTHLVRELVGVTLVDGLGGEEESGTVLGSHCTCVGRRGEREESSVTRIVSFVPQVSRNGLSHTLFSVRFSAYSYSRTLSPSWKVDDDATPPGKKNTTGAAMVMGTREKDLKGGEAIESSRGSGRLHTARSTGGDEGEKKNMTEKLNKRARSRPSTHAAENKTGVSCRDELE